MTHKTASINMRVNFIRQCLNNHDITLQFVPTALNVADTLTKHLATDLFQAHTSKLMEGFGMAGQVALVIDHIDTEDIEVCLCCFDSDSLLGCVLEYLETK
jgi:hypothetical protein